MHYPVEQNITKKITKLLCFLIKLLVILSIPFLMYIFLWTPDEKKARSLIRNTSGYYPPISTKLIYSKNYWESLDGREPRSMCFVFQYSPQDLMTLQNYNFPNISEDKIWYLSSPIPTNRGCSKFLSSLDLIDLELFNKRFEYLKHLEGSTIFINANDRIVMFEIYIFD